MKFTIVLIFMMFVSVSEASAQEFICKKTPLVYSKILNCPAIVPADALHAIFEKNFPEVSYQKVTHDNGESYSVFGTVDHAFYLKTTKDNKIIGLEQGLRGSNCHYVYSIDKATNGNRYCNVRAPSTSKKPTADEINCLSIWARDPISNPQNERVRCDIFLEAMLSCAKDSESTAKCKKNIYAFMNRKDNGQPVPNVANKPMPESESSGGAPRRPTTKALK